MALPLPPSGGLDLRYMNLLVTELDRELQRRYSREATIEVGAGRVVLRASDGSRWALQVSTSGVLSTVAA